MSKNIRDTIESASSLAGNFFLPGSSILTDQLVSKGAQKQLGSGVGKVAQVASGGTGAYEGNLANYGNIASSVAGPSIAPTAAPAIGAPPGIIPGVDTASTFGADAASARLPVSSDSGGILGSLGSDIKSVLNSSITTGIEKAAPLIVGGAQIYQAGALQKQALEQQKATEAALQPSIDVANQALQTYAAGTISEPQQASISQWQEQATAQVKNAYANMGLSGSTQEASALAQITQQAEAQKNTYVQQNFSDAISALGLSTTAFGGITRSQLQSAAGMNTALSNLSSALGKSAA
ncbi:MAG: hypothetical protein ACRD52_00675 [Candidatus Acidiferrales bacterium]